MFSPKPNQTINYKHGVLKINSLGFRGEEIFPNKPDSTYRIALLGGSVGFNGYSDSTTIIGFVEQLLEESINKEKYTNIETINAAVPGYISTQEMLVLILKLVDLKPDLVIIFDGPITRKLQLFYSFNLPNWHFGNDRQFITLCFI